MVVDLIRHQFVAHDSSDFCQEEAAVVCGMHESMFQVGHMRVLSLRTGMLVPSERR